MKNGIRTVRGSSPVEMSEKLGMAFCSIASAALHNTSPIRVPGASLGTRIGNAKGTYLRLITVRQGLQ